MANKSIYFLIFVLKEFFVRFVGINYPYELVPFIMKPIIETRTILKVKTCQVKMLREMLGLTMPEFNTNNCIKFDRDRSNMSLVTPNKLFEFYLTKCDMFYCEESELYIEMKGLYNKLFLVDNNISRSITFCIRNDTRHILRICLDSKETVHILREYPPAYIPVPKVKFTYGITMNYEEFCEFVSKMDGKWNYFMINSNGIKPCHHNPTKQRSFDTMSLILLRAYVNIIMRNKEHSSIVILQGDDIGSLVIQIKIDDSGKILCYLPPDD